MISIENPLIDDPKDEGMYDTWSQQYLDLTINIKKVIQVYYDIDQLGLDNQELNNRVDTKTNNEQAYDLYF